MTRESSLADIMRDGLRASFHGAIHGGMDIRPPRPAVYLSCKEGSDNLHVDLFDGSPLVVIQVAMDALDPAEMWPDDFAYGPVMEGDLLGSPAAIRRAIGCDAGTSRRIHQAIEGATEETLSDILKPFWSWYLTHPEGGEVAYTADIPPAAILSVRPYQGPANESDVDMEPEAPSPAF